MKSRVANIIKASSITIRENLSKTNVSDVQGEQAIIQLAINGNREWYGVAPWSFHHRLNYTKSIQSFLRQ